MEKEIKLDANGHRKFGMMDKIAYAAGDFGCNMSFSLKGTVQTFWLAFMMIETGLLSLLLLIVQIWDAINDPIIGAMIDADKRKYKMGKFKTYIFIGAVGLLVAGALVFLPFPNAELWVKCVLFIAGYIIWDACYTVANVPYGSMQFSNWKQCFLVRSEVLISCHISSRVVAAGTSIAACFPCSIA